MTIISSEKSGSMRCNPIRGAFMLLLSVAIVIFMESYSFAGGLSTGFSKVIMEGLNPGQSYDVEKLGAPPFEIKNTSNRKVELQIDIIIPKEDELSDGYLPIPDSSWLTLQKNHFEIEPGSSAKTVIFINIPNGEEYEGKKFAVFIWSHTVGESLGIGLKSKLLFTTIKQGQNL